MFFLLSKIFWVVARPLNALFLLGLVAAVLARLGWRRTGRSLLVAVAIAFAAIGFTQLPDYLLYRLEVHALAPGLPSDPAGIVVLGGGLASESAAEPDGYHLGEASDRLVRGLELKRLYPQARLIYSGGLSSLTGQGLPETEAARHVVTALYGDLRGIEFESLSRNTWENARRVAALAGVAQGGKWLLVTSAFHMPRALGCFRAIGMDVVAVPTDYRADPLRFPFLTGDMASQFLKMNILVKELIGLAAYRLTGRIDALLPR